MAPSHSVTAKAVRSLKKKNYLCDPRFVKFLLELHLNQRMICLELYGTIIGALKGRFGFGKLGSVHIRALFPFCRTLLRLGKARAHCVNSAIATCGARFLLLEASK
jgi:hypothetical protein